MVPAWTLSEKTSDLQRLSPLHRSLLCFVLFAGLDYLCNLALPSHVSTFFIL